MISEYQFLRVVQKLHPADAKIVLAYVKQLEQEIEGLNLEVESTPKRRKQRFDDED